MLYRFTFLGTAVNRHDFPSDEAAKAAWLGLPAPRPAVDRLDPTLGEDGNGGYDLVPCTERTHTGGQHPGGEYGHQWRAVIVPPLPSTPEPPTTPAAVAA